MVFPSSRASRAPHGSAAAIVGLAVLASSGASAEPLEAPSTLTSTRTATVTLEASGASAKDLLRHIARAGGWPLAVTVKEDRRVDLDLDAVPARTALALLLEQADLQAEVIDGVLVVSAAAPAPAPAPDPLDALEGEYAAAKDDLRTVLAGKDHTGTPDGPPLTSALPPTSAPPGEARPRPEFDGLPPRNASAGEILIWVPRAVFFPVHLVMNYLIRIPLIWTLTRMEEHSVIKRVERFLTFRDGKSIIYPTFFGDFGLRPQLGINNNNEDLFFRGNDMNLSVGYGGDDFMRFGATNTTTVLTDDSGELRLHGEFLVRPDQPYYGHGAFTSTDNRYNYKVRRLNVGWNLRAVLADLTWLRFSQTFRDVEFNDDAIDDTLGQLAPAPDSCGADAFENRARRVPFAPCGYTNDGGYRLLSSQVEVKLDSRNPDTEFQAGSGVLLEAHVSFEFDPNELERSFMRMGGEVAGFWDFTGVGHTLALRFVADTANRTGSSTNPIPFTELPSLGGLETMRGFLPRRFIGDSVLMTELSYRYPVWSILDAELFASVGNAFDGYFEGFSPERLHLSTGIGLRTSFTRDSSLQLLFAVGTNRFEEAENDNFEVDSIRFAFGYVQGF